MTLWTAGETIHRIIKRDIPISERGTIVTLNDLPDWMVEEARAIARESLVCAVRYLRFYVAREYADRAEDFIEDVLLKGQTARTWDIRDCICIPREPTRTTALELRYLDAMAKAEGERWFRVRPKLTAHRSDYITGMVGVVLRNTRYWRTLPPGLDCYLFARPEDIEVVAANQVESSIRRWIARRLAWWAQDYLEYNRSPLTGNEIIRAIPEADISRVTTDAKIAAAALAREAHAYGGSPDFPQQAGFLGPEEWYQSSSQEVASTDAPTSSDKGAHD